MSPRREAAEAPLDPAAFEAVADELYSLVPAEFTRARDAQVKQARSRGERALAEAVGSLRRPTAAAWLVNLLVREEGGRLEELLALAEALRTAQAGLDAGTLRQLSAQRHRVVSALAAQARRTAAGRGHPVSAEVQEQVEQTLEAALSDPSAADALRTGRLTVGLQYAGLGELTPVSPAPTPSGTGVGSGAGAGTRRTDAERTRVERTEAERAEAERAEAGRRRDRAEARQALAEAETGLADARQQADAATTRLRQAEERLAEVAARAAGTRAKVTALDERLAQLERERTELLAGLDQHSEQERSARADSADAEGAREAAARGAEVARRRVEAAQRRLDALAEREP